MDAGACAIVSAEADDVDRIRYGIEHLARSPGMSTPRRPSAFRSSHRNGRRKHALLNKSEKLAHGRGLFVSRHQLLRPAISRIAKWNPAGDSLVAGNQPDAYLRSGWRSFPARIPRSRTPSSARAHRTRRRSVLASRRPVPACPGAMLQPANSETRSPSETSPIKIFPFGSNTETLALPQSM